MLILNMKRFTILFLLILLARTISFSQNISNGILQDSLVIITQTQLKQTNLIFAEHSKLLKENKLLIQQVDNYILENNILLKNDSIRVLQIKNYQDINKDYYNEINRLNFQLKKKKTAMLGLEIGGITITVGLVLWLLLK